MQAFTYILKCADKSYYIGSTVNLEKRLWEHQNGCGSNFTKKNLPVELIYFEEFERIEDAFFREKQLQGWSRRKKEALIAGRSQDLSRFARCENDSNSKNRPLTLA